MKNKNPNMTAQIQNFYRFKNNITRNINEK